MGSISSKPNVQKSAIADASDKNAPPGSVLLYDKAHIPPQFVAVDCAAGQALPEKVARVHKEELPSTVEKMGEVRMILTEF